jgi:hypothetical protein
VNARRGALVFAVIVLIVLGLYVSTSGITRPSALQQANGISLHFFSLCVSYCLYPSPYLSGDVFLSGPSPLKALIVFVNGTEVANLRSGITPANRILQYNVTLPQSPVVLVGDLCALRFEAVFQDNSTAFATTVIFAF